MKTLIKLSSFFLLFIALSSSLKAQVFYEEVSASYGSWLSEQVTIHCITSLDGGYPEYTDIQDNGGRDGYGNAKFNGDHSDPGYIKCWCEISDKETIIKTINFSSVPNDIEFSFSTSDWHQKNELED